MARIVPSTTSQIYYSNHFTFNKALFNTSKNLPSGNSPNCFWDTRMEGQEQRRQTRVDLYLPLPRYELLSSGL